ncbi:heterogeneous nuclear ribonucleoprotein U-like protein 2 [Caloenas nicobarica]|uniref:heterogeneous nuclear ribonucleoprotein U-like protein 2 n=1 Tax=Caloenas nicobarica TaxID=187106 RepID=UPI0032B74B6D
MDVKRLKVTELRAELGRRGLDSRGLKVELAQRLQEALDAEMLAAGPEEGGGGPAGPCAAGEAGPAGGAPPAHHPGGGGDEEEEEEEEEDEEEEEEEDEEALLADEDEAAAAPAGAAATEEAAAPPGPAEEEEEEEEEEAPGEPALDEQPPQEQEKPQEKLPAAEPEPEAQEPQGPEGGGGVNGAERPPEEGPSGDEAAAAEAKEEEEGAPAGDEDDKSKAGGSDGERRGVKRQRDEKDEHGRAYYEFREEAYNSRSKSPPPPEEEPREEDDETLVILDTYTADLQFKATRDRYGGQPLFAERFPALWAGARSTHGVTGGRICFEAKVTQYLPVKEGSTEVPLFRVGWSVDFSHSQLGEDEFSYGYDGRGLKVENGAFEEFGPSFGENDVIGCFADFDGEAVELSFSKNGEAVGAAFLVPKEPLGGRALFPHVLCRNCAVELNFGQREQPLHPPPDGFTFIHALPPEQRVRTPRPPKTTEECEVLLMVGLPGAGKTTWAHQHTRENREKRFNVLGTESVLHQMRPRGPSVPELDAAARDLLTQQAAQCLSKLVQIAPRARRNFILDQCNVYNSGQRRKLQAFRGFQRKVVVVVPDEDEWKRRLELRKEAEGEDVPPSVMLEMKANFSIPEPGEHISEVVFAALGREEAAPLVLKLREEARKLLPPPEKRPNRRNNRNKRNRQNRSRGQGYVGGQRRGYDSRVYGGQQQQQHQYWGQPGNRGGYRNFYDRYRGDYDRFYPRDYEYNRYRDYYRQYNREWQNYYQDRDRYYRNYYGYQGYR